MTSFASLMALSATHTRESQQAVNSALQERKRKEVMQRKQQEERDAKEREREKKLRMKMFEEEKRQKEKQERLELERAAQEVARSKREEEQRNTLLYGPKKAAKLSAGSSGSPKYPISAAGAARDALRKQRIPEDDNDSSAFLTREEMRKKKQDSEMNRHFNTGKRSGGSTSGYHRRGRTMPGGAVNIVVNANGQQTTASSYVGDGSSGKSLKERLTQGPNTLTLLRTQVRDRRTVDEAQQDIRIKLGKATTTMLQGEDAKHYDGWFTSSSKDKRHAKSPVPTTKSKSSTPVPTAFSSSSRQTISSSASVSTSGSSTQRRASNGTQRPLSTKPLLATSKSSASFSRGSSSEKNMSSSSSQAKSVNKNRSSTSLSAPPYRPSSSTAHRESQGRSKRPRSPSLSESPPPQRRKHNRDRNEYDDEYDEDDDLDAAGLGDTIWQLFGKNRGDYTTRDVFSDDEDMEADATILEREELMSARIAKREEQQALAEERRHEEEKRQRKKASLARA